MPKKKINENKSKSSNKGYKESQEQYKILFESSSDAIMILDKNSFFDCNPATLKMFGMTKEEFTRVHPSEISPPKQPNGKSSRTEADKHIDEAFKKGHTEFEWVHLRSNGEEFPVTVWITAFPLDGRQVLQATIRDITEQKEMERAHMESDAQLHGIWECVQTGIVMIDADTRKIVDINNKALEMIGTTKKKVIGKVCHAYMCPSEVGKCPILDLGQSEDSFERVLLTADGKEIPIQKSVTTFKVGEKKYILDSFVDISQQKKIEAELKEYKDNLEKLVEERTGQLLNAEKEVRRLIQAVETSVNAVVILDLELNITYANISFGKMIESDLGDVLNKNANNYIGEKYLNLVYENIQEGLDDKEIEIFEIQIKTSKGNLRWVEIVGSIIYDDSGDPEGIMAIIKDITERKVMMEELIATEDKYQLLVEKSKDGILIIQEGKVAYMNPALLKLSGYSLKEQMGRDFLENVAPEARENVSNLFKSRILGKKVPSIYETLLMKKDGTRVPIEVNASVMEYNGLPADFVYLRDLTERKKAEEIIRQSEEKYRKLIETANDAIFLADARTGIIIDANKRAQKLIGRSRREIIGMKQTELHPSGKGKKYREIFERHIKDGTAIEGDVYAQHKDGHKIPVSISASTFELDGVPLIQGIFHDLTEVKKIQDALQKEKDFSETIIQAADAIIVGLNEKHHIQIFNQGAERITGYSSKEALGKDWFKLVFRPEMEKEMNKVWKDAWGKNIHSYINPIWSKSGDKKIITWSSSSVVNENGKTTMAISIGHEITEQEKAKEEAKASEERLRTFFNSMEDLVFGFDNKGNFTFHHSPKGSVLYQEPEEFIGKHYSEVMPPYLVEKMDAAFKTNKKGESITISYYIPIGESILWFSANMSPIMDKKEYKGTIAVVRDITYQKAVEDNIYQSEKIYRGLYESTIALADTTDLNEVIAVIAEQAKNMLSGECSTIYLWNESDQVLEPYYTNAEGDKDKFMKHRLKLGEGLTGSVAKEMKGSYSNYDDKKKIKGYIPGTGTHRDHLQSIIAEPMMIEDTLVGVINVIAEERKFTNGDQTRMDILAHQASIAYMRSQNLDELKQREEQYRITLDSLNDFIHVIDSDYKVILINLAFKTWCESLDMECNAIGQNVFDYFSFLPNKVKKEYEKVFKTGEVMVTEETTKVGDKSFFTITRKKPILKDGKVVQVMTIIRDITERKIAMEAVEDRERRFTRMAENIHDGLTIIENRETVYINERAVEIYGYSREELMNMSLIDLIIPEEREQMRQIMDNASDLGVVLGELEFWVEQKGGERRYVRTRTSTSIEDDNVNQFIITTDITDRKVAEDEIKRKKMKFLLEDGRAYLVKEFRPELSVEAFNDLVNIEYPGLFISRASKKDINRLVHGQFEHIWLGETEGDEEIFETIKAKLNSMPGKSVILMDRLDYLIIKYGFRETLAFLYGLRDTVYIKEQILILSIDPSTISEDEMGHIEKEMSEIEQRQVPRPNEEQFEIVEKIYEKNSTGIKPSFSEIGSELGLSKPTFRKRVRRLVANGYVVELTKGNKKVLELTQKGRSLFFK